MSPTLRQPSRVTCGAAVAVRAELMARARSLGEVPTDPATFSGLVLARHVSLTSAHPAPGHWQLPWPRTLGTPPWTLASHLEAVTGHEYRVTPVLHRAGVWARLLATAAPATPVPVYVGSRWLPRHVVLAHGSTGGSAQRTLTVYEPARGVDVAVTRTEWVEGPVALGGWSTPWAALLPLP